MIFQESALEPQAACKHRWQHFWVAPKADEAQAPLLARLETGRLDAAVLALPYPLGDVETEEIAQDRFLVVGPSGHRFRALAAVRPDDLAMEDLLLLEDGHCMRDHALAACALEGARRNVAFQGTSLQTLVQMVANGLGVTLVPQMAIDAGLLRGLDVAVLPLTGKTPFRRIALAWRRTSGRKETLRRLVAEIRNTARRRSSLRWPPKS